LRCPAELLPEGAACFNRLASIIGCNNRSILGSSFLSRWVETAITLFLHSIHPKQWCKLRIGFHTHQPLAQYVDTYRLKYDLQHLALDLLRRTRPHRAFPGPKETALASLRTFDQCAVLLAKGHPANCPSGQAAGGDLRVHPHSTPSHRSVYSIQSQGPIEVNRRDPQVERNPATPRLASPSARCGPQPTPYRRAVAQRELDFDRALIQATNSLTPSPHPCIILPTRRIAPELSPQS
jgi:hypothetical protein